MFLKINIIETVLSVKLLLGRTEPKNNILGNSDIHGNNARYMQEEKLRNIPKNQFKITNFSGY